MANDAPPGKYCDLPAGSEFEANWRSVALCAAINMLDGFDIMSSAYTAPQISKGWALGPAIVGWMLSSGLAGMMLGAISLGPVADRMGRRPVILACLAASGIGMLAAATSPNLMVLLFARFVTGFAVGGLLPALNSIVAEAVPARGRGLAVGLMQSGFAVGATIGGFAAAVVLATYGWRMVFAAGACVTLPLLLCAWLWLGETLSREPGLTPLIRFQSRSKPPYGSAWWLLLGAFSFSMTSLYFLLSWTPKVLVDAGFGEGAAVVAGAMLTAGGVLAALVVGWASRRGVLERSLPVVAVGSAFAMAAFGAASMSVPVTLVAAMGLGLLANCVQVGLYAACPSLFPPPVRAGATGLAVGLGRSGAVAGPLLGGWLFSLNASWTQLFVLMALPYLIAALFMARASRFARY